MSTVGAISGNTRAKSGWGKVAGLLNTPIVEVGNSKGLAAIAKTTVKCPANVISLFSSVMFAITGVNLLSKLNDFSTESLWGKTKQLFVPVVSGIAALLPHVITGLCSEGVKAPQVDIFSKQLTEKEINSVIGSFIEACKRNYEKIIYENPGLERKFTFKKFANPAMEIILDLDKPSDGQLTNFKKYYLFERKLFENGIPYIETAHSDSEMYSVLTEDGKKVVYGFRILAGPDDTPLHERTDHKIDVIFLAKYAGEDNSMFRPVGKISDFVGSLVADKSHTWIDTYFNRFNVALETTSSWRITDDKAPRPILSIEEFRRSSS